MIGMAVKKEEGEEDEDDGDSDCMAFLFHLSVADKILPDHPDTLEPVPNDARVVVVTGVAAPT